ncbi:MAG TPA: hypothetical protein VFA26_16295 [Gemmataceae bacterium]|nr:hypothetical protein [Gemmataceae bacterium]
MRSPLVYLLGAAVLAVTFAASALGFPPVPHGLFFPRLRCATFSPDGKLLLVGYQGRGLDKEPLLRLWDVATGKEVRSFTGLKQDVVYVEFLPDGKHALIRDRSDSFSLWDVSTGKEVRRIKTPESPVAGLALSADGKRLLAWAMLAADGKKAECRLGLWDVTNGELLKIYEKVRIPTDRGGFHLALSPDSKLAYHSMVGLLDLTTGKVIRALPKTNDLFMYGPGAFSPDSKLLVFDRRDSGPAQKEPDNRYYLELWDVTKAKEVHKFPKRPPFKEELLPPQKASGYARHIRFTPDGQQILTVDSDSALRLWDVAAGKELWSLGDIRWDVPPAVAFVKHGTEILLGEDGRILGQDTVYFQYRRLRDGKPLREIKPGAKP